MIISTVSCAQPGGNQTEKAMSNSKITVEVWSDFMCPFCYLGKRNFEKALERFPEQSAVNIVWKSFQLMPGLKTDTSVNIHRFLADAKGWSLETATQMNERVGAAAKEAGLSYNFSSMKVANTFLAHCFSQYSLEKGKQSAAEEKLFHAYFTEGKNLDDTATLAEIGVELGIDKEETVLALRSGKYSAGVVRDMQQAEQLGINGVPYFLINGKYVVNGAQPPEVFLQTLQRAATRK